MQRLFPVIVVFVLTAVCTIAGAKTSSSSFTQSDAWQAMEQDYANFYTRERFGHLGIAFGIGAIMANSHIDKGIRDWYQNNHRSKSSDNLAKKFKWLGNGYNTIPISLLAMGIGQLSPSPSNSVFWQWGQRTMRAYLVGAPPMLLAQRVTGGSRPQERPDASRWRPLSDSNGVSGHAFMGSIPFLTIADMTDSTWLRCSAYFASTLTGWSRINDDAHFASQVFLGWYMGYQAVDAVNDSITDTNHHNPHFAIAPWPHGVVLAINYQW